MPNTPATDIEKLAWYFAKDKHKNQMRKFIGKSYFDAHVQKVNGIIKLYTKSEILLIASLLHDVIEDCFKNKWHGYYIIKELFGQAVADIVMELTSDKDEIKYKYDGDKCVYLINKMLRMSDNAFTIKLADRLQNIDDAFTADESFRNKYYHETLKIAEILDGNRKMNKIQKQLLGDIKAKLTNIKSIFKL